MKTYQSKEIQELAGVSKTQLIHWTQTGVILPYVDAYGRGKVRTYNQQNLVEAMICKELSKFSIETHLIKRCLGHLRENTFTYSIGNESSFWDYWKSNLKHDFVYFVVAGKTIKYIDVLKLQINDKKIQSFKDITGQEFYGMIADPCGYGDGPVFGVISKTDLIYHANTFESMVIVNLAGIILRAGGLN